MGLSSPRGSPVSTNWDKFFSLIRDLYFGSDLFFQSILNIGVDGKTGLKGKHGNLAVDGWSETDVQHTCIAFVRRDALVLAIGQIVIDGLVEGWLVLYLYKRTLKIHRSSKLQVEDSKGYHPNSQLYNGNKSERSR